MAWVKPEQNQQNNNEPVDQSDKYDSQVIDDGDLLNEHDLNINPQIYIHMALQRCQVALLNPNLDAGLVQYVFLVQNIEMTCRSAGLINEDEYKRVLDEFKLKEEYKVERRMLYQQMSLAQEKLRLLLTELFSNRTSSSPLKL